MANALGSLSSASTAAVVGMGNGGSLSQHQSPLLNSSHYGVIHAGSAAGQQQHKEQSS